MFENGGVGRDMPREAAVEEIYKNFSAENLRKTANRKLRTNVAFGMKYYIS